MGMNGTGRSPLSFDGSGDEALTDGEEGTFAPGKS